MSDILPSPGTEKTTILEKDGECVRHGSSLSLIRLVSMFFDDDTSDDDFGFVDPTKDHKEWSKRGMSLYYAAIVSSTSTANQAATSSSSSAANDDIWCALRCVTDFVDTPLRPPHKRPRVLIDYVYTHRSHREKGLASKLVKFILSISEMLGANTYVLSLEESSVYWMEKYGFFLCENAYLNARLNVYDDTHLLCRGTDPFDEGDPADLCMDENNSDEDDDDSNSSLSSSSSSSSSLSASSEQEALLIPEAFRVAVTLVSSTPIESARTKEDIKTCLSTLARLIANAKQSATIEGDRLQRTIALDDTTLQQYVFSVSPHGMDVLLAATFEFTSIEEGEKTALVYTGFDDDWVNEGVNLLQKEAAEM